MKIKIYLSDVGLHEFNTTGKVNGAACQTDVRHIEAELDTNEWIVTSDRGNMVARKKKKNDL